MSLRNNLMQKARIYFRGNDKPASFQEAQTIYEFFKKRGKLIEFKYARSRSFLTFGFIRYHDNEITEQLLKEGKVFVDEIKKELFVESSNHIPGYQYEGYFIDYNNKPL
ncbi:8702_t:CDS:2 [Entrophospora sp. SA101]|nr:228_t:CDS:2 [Entrophospora sp. SA101]CAJ0640972.1 230_t:CDS:2 [Entrophospora sp. SA101]CAJ0760225.1 8702_t:CDS:2 [Entrophospora sp. SA101]CAJ0823296.1 3254_t:CDS:2 [Entrophospora sp. SA101]CAJ0849604.1 6836_t:CDS:2 [Entrophospora sp. SA101]